MLTAVVALPILPANRPLRLKHCHANVVFADARHLEDSNDPR